MVENIPDILGICDRYWRYLLKAERDAGKKLALLIKKKMGIPRDVFVFGSAKKRQSAVKGYLNRIKKNNGSQGRTGK